MDFLIIDQEKCKREGICAAVCPMSIIRLGETDRIPQATEKADKLCINCGHCVAACPHGALSLQSIKADRCIPVKHDWRLSPEQLGHFLRARRSIRIYKEKKVEREVLEDVFDTARYAPSGRNLQPVKWLIIYDSEEVSRLAQLVIDWMKHMVQEDSPMARVFQAKGIASAWDKGRNLIAYNAPHLIMNYAHQKDKVAQQASPIALTYLELAAVSFGLGTCWAGYLHAASRLWQPLQEALKLPEGNICLGAVMIGYPDITYYRIPKRKEANIIWH